MPQQPFYLVSNHVGYIDILLIGAHVEGTFLSRADVAEWPYIGWMIRLSGTLLIRREVKRELPQVMERLYEIYRDGGGVIVFPEGTTSHGSEVHRFGAALLKPAADHEIPVSYATLTYRTSPGVPPATDSVCWHSDMEFGPHIWGLLGLPRVDARLDFGRETIVNPERKMLARRLQDAVASQFQPVTGGEAEAESVTWGARVKGRA